MWSSTLFWFSGWLCAIYYLCVTSFCCWYGTSRSKNQKRCSALFCSCSEKWMKLITNYWKMQERTFKKSVRGRTWPSRHSMNMVSIFYREGYIKPSSRRLNSFRFYRSMRPSDLTGAAFAWRILKTRKKWSSSLIVSTSFTLIASICGWTLKQIALTVFQTIIYQFLKNMNLPN